MTLFITLTTAQADTGPFNLFSNIGNFSSAIAVNVTKAQLLAGYATSAPDGTTTVRVRSTGVCSTSLDLLVGAVVTTTTTAPPPPPEITTTTTSTTSLPVTTTTTTTQPVLTAR